MEWKKEMHEMEQKRDELEEHLSTSSFTLIHKKANTLKINSGLNCEL